MSEEKKDVTEEVKDEEQTEEVEEKDDDKQAEDKPDKPVEQSTFNKYRDAYMRERLSELKVNDEEVESAMQFIDERTDDTDSNIDSVLHDLRVRMRLEERINPKPVDPNPMNGFRQRPRKKNPEEIGHKAWDRIKNNTSKGRSYYAR